LRPCLAKYPWALTVLLAIFFLAACSTRKQAKTQDQQPSQTDQNQASEEAQEEAPSPAATPATPTVTLHISYAHRDDYLASVSVSKFASATLIPERGGRPGSALVRFEGGEPIWEIAANRGVSGSLLGHMPGVKENKKFMLTEVTYGSVPKNFSKEEPENSDPEPLEPGKYYIFTVQRASGAIGYQAVHITDDGVIEGYEGQPRAGTSYELCCNLAPDFASPESPGGDTAPDVP
jgi:hypothetical protein